MNHTFGDAPIEPEYVEQMTAICRGIDEIFNGNRTGPERTVGFVLLVFPFGDGGRANYMSNADRADIIVLLKEQLARFEGMPKQQGRA